MSQRDLESGLSHKRVPQPVNDVSLDLLVHTHAVGKTLKPEIIQINLFFPGFHGSHICVRGHPSGSSPRFPRAGIPRSFVEEKRNGKI